MPGQKFSWTPGATQVVVAAVLIVTLVLAPDSWAAGHYRSLHRFTGPDGFGPYCGLIFDPAGNLYGTTFYGGAYGYGAVFKLSPNGHGGWTESVLHSFQLDQVDGNNPYAGLIFDATGNLYGTTFAGGFYNYGMVFQLTPNKDGSWTENVLHQFNGTDGAFTYAGLISDAAGNLYGASGGGAYGHGLVFELKHGSWNETVLYSFKNDGKDGNAPDADLMFDPAGNLYGTTYVGGTYNSGTVFQLTPSGNGSWTESVLHSFNGSDGYFPWAALIFDAAGNLYGTTSNGGSSGTDSGTVFQLTPNGDGSWAENVLHSFDVNGKDGYRPYGVIFDPAGNLYGTTTFGGTHGNGTIYQLKPSMNGGWKETVLHSFADHPGANPSGVLIFDGHDNLYGTTFGDATTTVGSVFEFTP